MLFEAETLINVSKYIAWKDPLLPDFEVKSENLLAPFSAGRLLRSEHFKSSRSVMLLGEAAEASR